MSDNHLRYYYKVEYIGKARATGNNVRRIAQVEQPDIVPKDFPYQPPETYKPSADELTAVVNALAGNLPSDVESLVDYKIERRDEFSEMLGITRTTTRLICKWTCDQTFTLTADQSGVFKFIENELMNISLKWGEWKTLFGPPYSHLALLQGTASTSFSIIRESLMHEIMLSIRRLFDPEGSPPRENCTFPWLAKHLAPGNKHDEFVTALDALKGKIDVLTMWRHKAIAHNDYEHALKQKLLPTVELDGVYAIIKEMSAMMNIVQTNLSTNTEGRYMLYETVYSRGGAESLLNFLKRGHDHRDKSIQALKKRIEERDGPQQQ